MKRHDFTNEEVNYIVNKYKNNTSGIALAKEFNVTKKVIYRILKENNLTIRDHSSCQRHYGLNEDFFSNQNSIMAYVLGFIAADGCISDDNRLIINLSQTDKDFLEQINQLLENQRPIKNFINNEGYGVSSLLCCSLKMKKDLSKFGIVPRKTFKNVFPVELEDRYKIDWIRGYFDGDGCISKSNGQLCFSIVSVNKNTLEEIKNFLYSHCGIPEVNINSKNPNLYLLRYSTNSSKKLFNTIYYPDVKLFLPRKYLKYSDFMK